MNTLHPNDADTRTLAKSDGETNLPFCWVITSDPQYPRVKDGGEGSSEDKTLSEQLIRAQYAAVNVYRNNRNTGQGVIPVFINGDITEYYHGDQSNKMKSLMGLLGTGVYYGLGNHDYENNFRPNPGEVSGPGCYNNSCIQSALRDMVQHYEVIKPDDKDYIFSQFADSPIARAYGSFAYSKTLGEFLFIQLQNHPGFTRDVEAIETRLTTYYHLSKSLDWLEKQLKAAQANKKFPIINMHYPPTASSYAGYSAADISRFQQLVNDYGVKAIFHGHTHSAQKEPDFGNVPVFNSGAGFHKTFLTAEYDTRDGGVDIRRATDNVIESSILGTFQVKHPDAPPSVDIYNTDKTPTSLYLSVQQSKAPYLRWKSATLRVAGQEPVMLEFGPKQDYGRVSHRFKDLRPETEYDVTVEATTHTGVKRIGHDKFKTPSVFVKPEKFCTTPKASGWEARWRKPGENNWGGHPDFFEVGIFKADGTVVHIFGSTAEMHFEVPQYIYDKYKNQNLLIGARFVSMTNPDNKGLFEGFGVDYLPIMDWCAV